MKYSHPDNTRAKIALNVCAERKQGIPFVLKHKRTRSQFCKQMPAIGFLWPHEAGIKSLDPTGSLTRVPRDIAWREMLARSAEEVTARLDPRRGLARKTSVEGRRTSDAGRPANPFHTLRTNYKLASISLRKRLQFSM